MMITTICLYGLALVLESVVVKFSATYLELKVSEKSGIGPPLPYRGKLWRVETMADLVDYLKFSKVS